MRDIDDSILVALLMRYCRMLVLISPSLLYLDTKSTLKSRRHGARKHGIENRSYKRNVALKLKMMLQKLSRVMLRRVEVGELARRRDTCRSCRSKP